MSTGIYEPTCHLRQVFVNGRWLLQQWWYDRLTSHGVWRGVDEVTSPNDDDPPIETVRE